MVSWRENTILSKRQEFFLRRKCPKMVVEMYLVLCIYFILNVKVSGM